jgi:hypothetical protein
LKFNGQTKLRQKFDGQKMIFFFFFQTTENASFIRKQYKEVQKAEGDVPQDSTTHEKRME